MTTIDPPRIAIVTGAGKGIGLAIARRLTEDGCHVILVDVDDQAGSEAVITIGEKKGAYYHCDIANEDEVTNLFEVVLRSHGAPDIVVNNAGILRDRMIWDMTADDFDRVISVNLKGTWLMCRQAAIVMRERKSGAIVNVASRAWLGNPGQTNYSASKAGIVGLTRSLALELGRHNVRVNAVAPGLIDTPMTQGLRPDVLEKLIQAQPTKTMGHPDDVAEAVSFFASQRNRFITGQVIYVDGGKSIGAG